MDVTLCKSPQQVKDCDFQACSILLPTMSAKKTTTYADAGVSINHGNRLIERIKPVVDKTRKPGVMSGLGGFGALFDISNLGYQQPVLVSGTDGVGTKIKLALETGTHHTIGIDLVAMCVNDLLVQGARPLFFLDYYVCEKLDVEIGERVITGIAKGCEIAGCSLVGGETAEHPGAFPPGEYDLAGFCVGVVEKNKIIDGSNISPGDALIGLASSGAHSNGFSLIRKVLADTNTRLTDNFSGSSFADVLLTPTRIYVKSILILLEQARIKGMSHITGGGLLENIPRMLPENVTANINRHSWEWPPIFTWLRERGHIEENEMFRTFNCGVGYVLAVENRDLNKAISILEKLGETAWHLGNIVERTADTRGVHFA